MTTRDLARGTGFHRTLHGQIVDSLGRRVAAGDWAAGSTLPNEVDLSAELGVARGGVREAVKALAAKGMVETRPRTGTRVRPRTEWNLLDPAVLAWHTEPGAVTDGTFLRHLTQFRRLLEPGAAEFAATEPRPEQLRDLERAWADMEAAFARLPEDAGDYAEADLAFHQALYRASGNELLEQVGASIARALRNSLGVTMHAAGDTFALHGDVLRAVTGGDPALAGLKMRQLIDLTSTHLPGASAG